MPVKKPTKTDGPSDASDSVPNKSPVFTFEDALILVNKGFYVSDSSTGRVLWRVPGTDHVRSHLVIGVPNRYVPWVPSQEDMYSSNWVLVSGPAGTELDRVNYL